MSVLHPSNCCRRGLQHVQRSRSAKRSGTGARIWHCVVARLARARRRECRGAVVLSVPTRVAACRTACEISHFANSAEAQLRTCLSQELSRFLSSCACCDKTTRCRATMCTALCTGIPRNPGSSCSTRLAYRPKRPALQPLSALAGSLQAFISNFRGSLDRRANLKLKLSRPGFGPALKRLEHL